MRYCGGGDRRLESLVRPLDPAVHHADAAITQVGKPRFVRNQYERGAAVAAPREEMLHHQVAGRGVEIPGGLVGKEETWPIDQGAGDCHPLLLAAGELAGVVPQPVFETDRGQLRPCASEGAGPTGELARRRHVLDRGHGRDEVECLEDDSDVPPPKSRESVLVESAQIPAGHRDLPGGGPFQTADDHEQRGLSGTGGPDDAHRFPGRHVEIDAAQDLHRTRGAGQCDVETSQRYDGMAGGGHRHGETVPSVGAVVQGDVGQAEGAEIQPGRSRGIPRARYPSHESPKDTRHAPRRSRNSGGRAVHIACMWLLAWVSVAAASLAAETRAEELRILMLGDRLTAGYGLASRDTLPVRLETALRARGLGVQVINAGVSGDTPPAG